MSRNIDVVMSEFRQAQQIFSSMQEEMQGFLREEVKDYQKIEAHAERMQIVAEQIQALAAKMK